MHITVKKTVLSGVLARATSVAPKKASIPILTHVLLRAGEDHLSVSATDLEVFVQLPCPLISIEKRGKVALPAAKLKELVEVLPDETVELRLLDNFRVEITSREHVSRMAGMDPSEFPQFSTAEEPESNEIHADELHQIITVVSHAICSDAAALHLNGVFFRAEGDLICGCATDKHRVSVAGKRIDSVDDWGKRLSVGAIIPRRGVEEIKRLDDRPLDLHLGRSSLDLIQGDSALMVRLIDGQYPEWRNYIPKDYTSFFTVDNASLIDAVNRVRLLSDGGHVRIDLREDLLLLHAESATNEALDSVSCMPGNDQPEEDLSVRFNSRYLLEALGSLGGGNIVFKYRNGVSPFLLLPADYGRWDERLELVLPLRL